MMTFQELRKILYEEVIPRIAPIQLTTRFMGNQEAEDMGGPKAPRGTLALVTLSHKGQQETFGIDLRKITPNVLPMAVAETINKLSIKIGLIQAQIERQNVGLSEAGRNVMRILTPREGDGELMPNPIREMYGISASGTPVRLQPHSESEEYWLRQMHEMINFTASPHDKVEEQKPLPKRRIKIDRK